MNILFDIGHPAHVHFFRHPIKMLREHGHNIIVTSRMKEFALDLLDEMGIQHIPLSSMGKGGLFSMAGELIKRNIALLKVAKKNNIDIMAAIGGVSIAHVTRLTGIPSLVFYDTENATLQNLITYPFASQVIVPACYTAWLPKNRHIRYAGYHELSYLHPTVFTPDRETAIRNGLAKDSDTFFIRVVSWQASHDIGEQGWSRELLQKIVSKLARLGKVLISSETKLTDELAEYSYQGKLSEVHNVLAFCKAFIGESATMASECAVLGVPAIYAAETGRGYTDEQEQRYGLVKNLREIDWSSLEPSIDNILKQPDRTWHNARENLLKNTINVAEFITDSIESYPKPPTLVHQPINS
jgi:predicted glycosyltransferase